MSMFAGVRVLDLSRMLAGPYGSMLLADMGADVIKVEDPDGGDPMRAMGPPYYPDGESAYFLSVNRNKRSVAIDLTRGDGRAVFFDLVRTADVVWHNFRPGIMEKLGCDYATLAGLNPRLIMCSISAYGQDGPYREYPAFDLALQAMGGAMSLTGEPGGPPVRMGLPMGDLSGGMFGAFAVAGALFERTRTGAGKHLDLALLDCQVSLLSYMAQYYWTDGQVPQPQGTAHAQVVPYQALQASDGSFIVAVFAEKFWAGFCRAAARPDWERDPRFATNRDRVKHRAAFAAEAAALFPTRPREEWLARLHAEGVPAAPILSIDRVVSDPQVKHRAMTVEMTHPRQGTVPTLGTPVKTLPPEPFTARPPARLGEHTDAILGDLPGYDPARIKALREARAIA